MRALVKTILALALLALSAGGYWWFYLRAPGAASAAQGGGAPPAFAMPVEAVQAKEGNINRQITAVGTLRSDESVTIRPEVAGRVAQISFEEGRRVRQGEVLLKLDEATWRAELDEARAILALAKSNAQRADELHARGSGSAQARDQAMATLHGAEARVALLQARLEKTALVAPINGVVGLRKVSPGAYVEAGQEIVNLENVDPIKVDFRVPEIWFAAVKVGQKIAVKLDALPGRNFEGEVYAIDPQVDVEGRSIVLRARVPNADDLLRPGLFARVTLVLPKEKPAIIVPEAVLMPIGSDQFVFKVVDGKAALTKVKLGDRRGGMVEITEGLAAGDTVVTGGQIKLRNGMSVQVVPGAPAS
jgi:membrane fusion protein (multidrug efflux system)